MLKSQKLFCLRPIKNAIGAEEPEEGFKFPMFGTEMMPKDSIVELMAEQNYKEDPFYLIKITDEEKEAVTMKRINKEHK